MIPELSQVPQAEQGTGDSPLLVDPPHDGHRGGGQLLGLAELAPPGRDRRPGAQGVALVPPVAGGLRDRQRLIRPDLRLGSRPGSQRDLTEQVQSGTGPELITRFPAQFQAGGGQGPGGGGITISSLSPGELPSRCSDIPAHAAATCSQLSRASSSRRGRSTSASVPASGRPGSSPTPMTAATRGTTRSGCRRSASSTNHTPSGTPPPSARAGAALAWSSRRPPARTTSARGWKTPAGAARQAHARDRRNYSALPADAPESRLPQTHLNADERLHISPRRHRIQDLPSLAPIFGVVARTATAQAAAVQPARH
jgi:hypothetical protein